MINDEVIAKLITFVGGLSFILPQMYHFEKDIVYFFRINGFVLVFVGVSFYMYFILSEKIKGKVKA